MQTPASTQTTWHDTEVSIFINVLLRAVLIVTAITHQLSERDRQMHQLENTKNTLEMNPCCTHSLTNTIIYEMYMYTIRSHPEESAVTPFFLQQCEKSRCVNQSIHSYTYVYMYSIYIYYPVSKHIHSHSFNRSTWLLFTISSCERRTHQ